MEINFKLIGIRIQQKRKSIKKTQENLAEFLGVSVGYVSLVERGKTTISLSTLAKIAEFLSCTIGELVEGTLTDTNSYLLTEINEKISSLDYSERELLFKLIDTYVKNK